MMALIFQATGRKNYSIEAFTILSQYHFLFLERMRMQLQWSKTVIVHGRIGKNASCDLHMEYRNRECLLGSSVQMSQIILFSTLEGHYNLAHQF